MALAPSPVSSQTWDSSSPPGETAKIGSRAENASFLFSGDTGRFVPGKKTSADIVLLLYVFMCCVYEFIWIIS
jgi:hypothetical protein